MSMLNDTIPVELVENFFLIFLALKIVFPVHDADSARPLSDGRNRYTSLSLGELLCQWFT